MATKAIIPKEASEVTQDWLKQVLQEASDTIEKDIKVLSLDQQLDNTGDLSKTFKASVQIEGQGTKRLFIKIGLPADSPIAAFARNFNVDITEINAYKTYLPELIQFEQDQLGRSDLAEILPKIYAADFSPTEDSVGIYIVMEDLTIDHSSFSGQFLTVDQVTLNASKMARFHGISLANSTIKKITYPDELKFKFPNFLDEPGLAADLKRNFPKMINDFEQDPQLQTLAPYLKRLYKSVPRQNTPELLLLSN